MACPAAVAQSARSVATLFRRIIVAIGPASTRDEGAALWRRNIAASASLVAAPASLVAGSARVPVEGARARAGRAAVCVCVCRPRAAAAAARARRGAVRARPLWRQIFGAPASPVVGGRAAARRAPLCVSRPRAAAAAAAGQRGASAGLFWKRAPRPKLPRRCRRRARRAVRCGPGRPRGSDFSAVNVLCASVLPQELKHTMRRLSNFGASRYVAATST